jgi:hypothetical protein
MLRQVAGHTVTGTVVVDTNFWTSSLNACTSGMVPRFVSFATTGAMVEEYRAKPPTTCLAAAYDAALDSAFSGTLLKKDEGHSCTVGATRLNHCCS